MQELDKGIQFSVGGELQDEALRKCLAQLSQWQVPVPAVTPLVMDFGLGDFYKYGLTEFWIANEVDAGYCGKFLFLFDGQTCPMHRHRIKQETFFVMHGQMRTEYDGEVHLLNPGDSLLIKPWKYHDITGVGSMLLLELSMPGIVDDNYFLSPQVPIGQNFQPETSPS